MDSTRKNRGQDAAVAAGCASVALRGVCEGRRGNVSPDDRSGHTGRPDTFRASSCVSTRTPTVTRQVLRTDLRGLRRRLRSFNVQT